MSSVTTLMTRAQELTVAAATDTVDPTARRVMAHEAESIFRELATLGNTTLEGEYLFGRRDARR